MPNEVDGTSLGMGQAKEDNASVEARLGETLPSRGRDLPFGVRTGYWGGGKRA